MRFCVPAMACCLPSRDQSNQANFIIDVEQILQDYVWNVFKTSRPPWQQVCVRRKDFEVDVPMNYFHFDKMREEVRPRQRSEVPTISQPHPSLAAGGMTHIQRDFTKNPLLANSNVMVLSTDFTNCTERDQTYKFRFEKTRKAALNVTFQRGFTVGGKVNFSLGLPKVVAGPEAKLSGELDMRVSVSKATGELIEETLTWETTSDINVAKTSNYTAKVLLSEAPVSYNFKLWTRMSMPTGAAPATVRRKNNNNFRYTHVIENLKLVFHKYDGVVDFIKEPLGRDAFTYAIVLKTTGIVDGVRLSDQKILLESKEMGRKTSVSYGGYAGHPQLNVSDFSPGDMTSDGCHGDGFVLSHPTRSGRMLVLASHPPPAIPMIEEMPEDDGGVGEFERTAGECQSPQYPLAASARANCTLSGQLPRITTTPSSQASSPMSDTCTGSPDMSETSKKSETITTV